MSARNKLNAANLNGALFVAGLLGLLTGSGAVFVVAAAALALTSWLSGEIRPRR